MVNRADQMVKDRLVRIESKLSRHIEDQKERNLRVDETVKRVNEFLDQWDQIKEEITREGAEDAAQADRSNHTHPGDVPARLTQ